MGLWLTLLSILFFPLCTSESPLCSFTLGDSRVGRPKPVWAKQSSQDLWKSRFLALKKKKPQETSLSLPGYEHGIMQNRLPSAAVLQPVRNTGLKITLILVLQRISALDSGTQVSEKSESSMALLSYRTRAIQGWPEPQFLNFSQIIWMLRFKEFSELISLCQQIYLILDTNSNLCTSKNKILFHCAIHRNYQ